VGDQKGRSKPSLRRSNPPNLIPRRTTLPTCAGRYLPSRVGDAKRWEVKRTFGPCLATLIAEMKNPHDKSTVLFESAQDQLWITGDITGATKAVDAFAELHADRSWTRIAEQNAERRFTGAEKRLRKHTGCGGQGNPSWPRVAVGEAKVKAKTSERSLCPCARRVVADKSLTEARSKAFFTLP